MDKEGKESCNDRGSAQESQTDCAGQKKDVLKSNMIVSYRQEGWKSFSKKQRGRVEEKECYV